MITLTADQIKINGPKVDGSFTLSISVSEWWENHKMPTVENIMNIDEEGE